MSQRANLFSLAALLLSLGVFLAITIGRTGPPARALQGEALNFTCEASCSRTELGVPIIELSWNATAADLERQALEVTVFSDGFQRGVFARLAPVRRDQKFALVVPPNQPENVGGLVNLALAGFDLSDGGRVRVPVRGVEPGLIYFWRLRSADGASVLSGVIDCEAPACPVDPVTEPTFTPPR